MSKHIINSIIKVWKRFFWELWWGSWGITPALIKSSLQRGCFGKLHSLREGCRSSIHKKSPGNILEVKAEVCEGESVFLHFWKVSMTFKMVGKMVTGKVTPEFHLYLSRGMPHMCRAFKPGETKIILNPVSPSSDTTLMPEWPWVMYTTPHKAIKKSKIGHSRKTSASKMHPLRSYNLQLTLEGKWYIFPM